MTASAAILSNGLRGSLTRDLREEPDTPDCTGLWDLHSSFDSKQVGRVAPRATSYGTRKNRRINHPSGHGDPISGLNQAYDRGRCRVLVMAQHVWEARRVLRHGKWTELTRSGALHFSKRKAEMLARIGEAFAWVDAQTFAHLPAAITTLHTLAKLDAALLARLYAERAIEAKMVHADAVELVARCRGESPAATSVDSDPITRKLRRMLGFVLAAGPSFTEAQLELARELLRALGRLCANPESHIQLGPVCGRRSSHPYQQLKWK